jgi:mono/diheme cytochrome c family protein
MRAAFLALILILVGTPNGLAKDSQFLTLPSGNPVEGRQAFQELKCNSCHRILSDIEMAGPIAKAGAPDLGLKQSRYRPSYLADSIVFPNHVVLTREGRSDHFAKSSRMGDFSDTLTVKQLADIVAYLKQLDEEV